MKDLCVRPICPKALISEMKQNPNQSKSRSLLEKRFASQRTLYQQSRISEDLDQDI